MFAFSVEFCLLCMILCLGWLLCCSAWRQVTKGVRRSRQKIEEVKRRKPAREKRQANFVVEKAAADKRDVTIKAEKLKQKAGMGSVMTPIEEGSRWPRAKSWVGWLAGRPRTKMEKDVKQDAMEMKENPRRVRIDSDTEVDDPVVAVEEESGPGSQQPWSPI